MTNIKPFFWKALLLAWTVWGQPQHFFSLDQRGLKKIKPTRALHKACLILDKLLQLVQQDVFLEEVLSKGSDLIVPQRKQ